MLFCFVFGFAFVFFFRFFFLEDLGKCSKGGDEKELPAILVTLDTGPIQKFQMSTHNKLLNTHAQSSAIRNI